MQTATAMIRIAGSLLQTVRKRGLTPGEVVILKHLHGEDSVTQLELERVGFSGDMTEEWSRLESTYGAQPMRDCFPGHTNSLPKNFAEIGIKINMETRKTRMLREMESINDDADLEDSEFAELFEDGEALKDAAGND